MTARFLRTSPCQDACGTLPTDRAVDGATVYRCPGCDAEWIELADVVDASGGAGAAGGTELTATPGPGGPSPISGA